MDFVALLARAPSLTDRSALGDAHWENRRLDEIYVRRDQLRDDPARAAPGWWARGGRLRGPSNEHRSPVAWAELARHGIAVSGPGPAELGIRDDPAALDEWLRGNLEGYWRRWLARLRLLAASGMVPAHWPSWGALGVARIHCTLATGRIVSKAAAAAFALERFPNHSPLIGRALAARAGGGWTRSAGLVAFMHGVIADSLSLPGSGEA
jgi:hypothetical protein